MAIYSQAWVDVPALLGPRLWYFFPDCTWKGEFVAVRLRPSECCKRRQKSLLPWSVGFQTNWLKPAQWRHGIRFLLYHLHLRICPVIASVYLFIHGHYLKPTEIRLLDYAYLISSRYFTKIIDSQKPGLTTKSCLPTHTSEHNQHVLDKPRSSNRSM